TWFSPSSDPTPGPRRHLDAKGSRQLPIIVQLAPRGFEFIPARKQFLDAGMFAHYLAGSFVVIEQMWVRDFAFELFEAFAFVFNERIKVHWSFVPLGCCLSTGDASTERGGDRSAKLSFQPARLWCYRSGGRIFRRARRYRRTSVRP